MAQDAQDAEIIRFQLNLQHAYRALGIDYTTRRVALVLMLDDEPWSIAGIATYLGMNRKSVLRALGRLRASGLLADDQSPVMLSPSGRKKCWKAYREVIAVAMWRKKGFSPDIVARSERVLGVTLREARTISLPSPRIAFKIKG